MDEAVFAGSPLADYLHEAGAEDWGIDDSFSPEPFEASPESAPKPQVPRQPEWVNAARDSHGLLPLILSDKKISKEMKQTRFRSLIRSAMGSGLSAKETERFLEQFRFAVVSSQLLDARPIYGMWSQSTDDTRCELLFSATGPWDYLKLDRKHWVGGGGCVLVVAVLFHWRSKQSENATARSNLAFVVAMLVILYLFGHSRRRLLRRLRSKSLGFIDQYIVAAKCLDGDIVRALRAVQDLELVDNGYSVMAIPRQSNRIRTGKKLRSVLSSALHLAIEAHLDAIKDCLCMCSEIDLGRYFEIYALNPSEFGFVMNDTFVGFTEDDELTDFGGVFGAASCYTPLSVLKQQFRRVHFLRRAFLCCMLAVPSSGQCTPAELESWTVVTDQLKSGHALMEQLSRMVTKERLYESPDSVEPAVESTGLGITHDEPERHASQRPALVDLGSAARHLLARIDIMQHRQGLTLDEYATHARQIDTEISELQRLWGSASWRFMGPVAESSTAGLDSPNADLLSPSTTAVDSSDKFLFSTPSEVSVEGTLHDDYASRKNGSAELFETVASSPLRPRSTLSRDERIRLKKQQADAARSAPPPIRDVFLSELENVLKQRAPSAHV